MAMAAVAAVGGVLVVIGLGSGFRSSSDQVPEVVADATAPLPSAGVDGGTSRSAAPSPTPTPAASMSATGRFSTVEGRGERAGRAGEVVEYRVEVEEGLGVDAGDFADAVEKTLADPRGWIKNGHFSFRRHDGARLRVVLASPGTTDELCAPLRTRGEVSCRNGDDVVINAVRWTEGVPYYDDLATYRQYVVNHEVGHALGYPHEPCPAPGAPAPVMLQQTLGLEGCAANPWP